MSVYPDITGHIGPVAIPEFGANLPEFSAGEKLPEFPAKTGTYTIWPVKFPHNMQNMLLNMLQYVNKYAIICINMQNNSAM